MRCHNNHSAATNPIESERVSRHYSSGDRLRLTKGSDVTKEKRSVHIVLFTARRAVTVETMVQESAQKSKTYFIKSFSSTSLLLSINFELHLSTRLETLEKPE